MDQIESDAAASAAAMLAVVEQLVLDSHGRAAHATLDSSLERELGLDSLARVELALRVEGAFGVSLPERALYSAETPRDLLRLVHGGHGARRVEVEKDIRSLVQTEAGPGTCQEQTLLAALEWHAYTHPDRLQVHLYTESGEEELSYAAVQRGAAGYASRLAGHGLQPGQTVAIMLPTGRDYLFSFFGILMAGGVPVPLYPPARPGQIEEHLKRHAGILDNCRAAMLITVPEARTVALLLRSQVASLQQVLMPSDLAAGDSGFAPFPASPGDIAFLQYTSGSTGNPKGVVLTHANLVANIRGMGEAVQANSSDVFVSWLPLYHDMGLIGAWFAALYLGFPTVLMSPLAFLSHPSRWLWAIHRHRGTLSGGPNFSYELCLKRIRDEQIEGLDLSCWRYAFNGAEPVNPETLAAFQRRFEPYGLPPTAPTPVYGLAEASVGLAVPAPGKPCRIDRIDRSAFQNKGEAQSSISGDATALEVPSCGRVIAGHALRVVDSAGVELADRHEGRLQFRGPSATSGYYRNPEQTKKLFSGDWLDTGDLAYLAEGELYISGRAKDIIIRGGRNLYPYELEEMVGAIPSVRRGCVAVFGVTVSGQGTEKLVVVAESRETDAAARQELVRRINALTVDLLGTPPDDVVLAPPNAVLKTSSGKIRRAATRDIYCGEGFAHGGRSLWLQVVRLRLAGFWQSAVASIRRSGELLYGVYAWCIYGLLLPPAAVGILLLPSAALRWRFAGAIARTCVRLCGIRLQVEGLEHVPRQAGVFVANHASYIDSIVLAAALPVPVSFIAKQELATHPFAGPLLRRLGAAFVERFDARQGVDDVRRLAQAAGTQPLFFFAEGTFTRQKGLRPFRLGAFQIAVQNGLAVTPVVLAGTREILRDESWLPRRGSVRVSIGAPIVPAGEGWQAALQLRDATRTVILRECGEPDLDACGP